MFDDLASRSYRDPLLKKKRKKRGVVSRGTALASPRHAASVNYVVAAPSTYPMRNRNIPDRTGSFESMDRQDPFLYSVLFVVSLFLSLSDLERNYMNLDPCNF